ncbi:Hypothetical predicted protein, partial [Marmota monax]
MLIPRVHIDEGGSPGVHLQVKDKEDLGPRMDVISIKKTWIRPQCSTDARQTSPS